MPETSATIVVPCYNEEQRLDVSRFADFVEQCERIHLLFVDDVSSDKTLDVLETLASRHPERIETLALPRNMGKAEAVRHGFARVFAAGPGYVGFWDADLATPLETIPLFCALLDEKEDVEMVIGARVQLLGRAIERQTMRHYLGRIFATVASLVLDLKVYDTQCGAKLFRASPKLEAVFREPFTTRWIFDVEIIARLICEHRVRNLPSVEGVIYEYPLPQWRDIGGSKLKTTDFFKAFLDIFAIYRIIHHRK